MWILLRARDDKCKTKMEQNITKMEQTKQKWNKQNKNGTNKTEMEQTNRCIITRARVMFSPETRILFA
jgi:hypothetical protein